MRPLRLTLENFTCFRGEDHTIDFTAFDLFAISGPTGAGKTSILDGIIYALYGKVPRMTQNMTEMISQGRRKMAVTLDFQVRGATYRVVRKTFAGGKATEAQLERLEGERRVPLGSGVRSVSEEIGRLLSLGFDAFTQSVVLPQGEFSKFIKSNKADRNKILTELLRLGIFELMRKSASTTRDRLNSACVGRRDLLEREYIGATPEALERCRAEFIEAESASVALEAERNVARAEADSLKRLRDLCAQLEEQTGEQRRLEAEAAEMVALTARIEAAHRAERARPLQAEAMRATQREAEAAESARAAAAQAAALHEQLGRAEEQLAAVEAEADALEALRERQAALAAVIPLMQQIIGLRERLAQAAPQRADAARDIEAIARRVEDCRERESTARTALEQAARALAQVGYVPGAETRYDDAREDAVELRAQRRRQGELVGETQKAKDLAERLRDDAVRLADEAKTAELERDEKSAAAQQADERLEAGRLANLALAVRHQLTVGAACPVCTREVEFVPELHDATVDLKTLEAARNQAVQARDAAAQKAASKRAESAAAQRSADEAAKLWEARQRESTLIDEVILRLSDKLTPLDVAGDSSIEERVLDEARRLSSLRSAYDSLRQAQLDAERVVVNCAAALALEETAGEVARTRLEGLTAQYARDERDLEVLEAQKNAVTADDAALEHRRISNTITDLERRLSIAQAAVSRTTSSYETATALAAEREAARQRDEALSRAARRALDEALQAEGFADDAALAAAAMERAALDSLEARVRRHQDDLLVTSRRLSELEAELQGRRVTIAEAGEAAARLADLETRCASESQRVGKLRAQLDSLTSKLERADELRALLATDEAELSVYKQLCDDLRNDRFQTWMLDDTFKAIVSGASQRLLRLTQRYEMEVHSDAFYVLDNDNAREKRSADTLSGGETFLASLALALELSEQIQAASGAARLDSLFIDEGFGTLDPETLDTVAQALEALTDGGRMVGIITHIAELTERLPARLLVKKQGDGARVITEG